METLYDSMKIFAPATRPMKTPKQLLRMVKEKYTIDQVRESVGLQTLYDALKIMSSHDGDAPKIPSMYVQELIALYLGETFPILS